MKFYRMSWQDVKQLPITTFVYLSREIEGIVKLTHGQEF